MKKRFLSLLCVLALCLGLLPVTALAAENDRPYSLYVGNTDVAKTEYSDNAAYWTSSDGGTNWTSQLDEPTADSYIHYDGNGTLTLHNVNISRSNENGIYAEAMSGSAVSLTIKLEGTNTVSGWSGIFVHTVYGAASLSISGTGSLTAEGTGGGSFSGIQVQSNDGKAELTINNVDVTATNNVAQGIILRSGGSSTASLTVNGGELTASGSDAGIKYVFGSSGTGDGTPTVTVSDNAIVRANGGISDDSSTDIQIGADSNESNGGIVFDGKNGTVYGDVELQEDLEIGEGESLTIGQDASLNTGSHEVIVNGGTLTGEVNGQQSPQITTPPQSQIVTEGESATFTIEASGSEPLSYQWQESTDSGSNWKSIAGATSTSYEIATTSTDMSDHQYRCVVTASSVSVVSDAATLTVNAPTTYTISADVDPVGAGTVSGGGKYTAGTSVTLTATNNPGYRFVGWVEGEQTVSTDTTYTFTANSDHTLTAKFEQVYTVTVSSTEGGTATGGGTYAKGDTVTLTATPNSGYRFVGWLESGTTVSTNTNYTFAANSDRSLTAQFDRISSGGGDSDPTYSITLPSRVTGGELKLSRRYAEKGETVTLTAIPDEGYELDTLTVTDSKGKEIELTHKGGNEYTFKMPAGRVEIEVSFREIEVELPFTDVPEGAWYEDAAAYVYEHGLMAGTSATTFAPDATTSRSMIATILWRMAGSPVVNYAMDYTDVAQGQWYSEAIRWAASEGIVGGYGNGLFGTNDPITREQFAAMLYRFAQEQGYDVSIGENTNILSYTDVADLSEYAISAMQWAVGAGIINGTGDGSTLSPHGQATRAQAAVMLMRFCEEYVTW